MAIKFSCGSCGKRFTAKNDHAGRRSKCPACGWGILVPFQMEGKDEDSPISDAAPISLPPSDPLTVKQKVNVERRNPIVHSHRMLGVRSSRWAQGRWWALSQSQSSRV